MHFLREATGPIYGSGLKEKTILASITNFHFAINAKKKQKKQKQKTTTTTTTEKETQE